MIPSLRESFNNCISGDKAESSTRIVAIFLIFNLAGWMWYAMVTAPPQNRGIVPHIEMILVFIATCLGLKWYNERKTAETKPEVTQ